MTISPLVRDAMLKDAADAITRNCPMLAQVTRDGTGIVLELDDKPHTQLTLRVDETK